MGKQMATAQQFSMRLETYFSRWKRESSQLYNC